MWVWNWDRPLHRELRPLQFTKSVWFFNVPQNLLHLQGLLNGAYGLSSLSEKQPKENKTGYTGTTRYFREQGTPKSKKHFKLLLGNSRTQRKFCWEQQGNTDPPGRPS